MTKTRVPRPLESFAPELLDALRRATLSPLQYYAEANKAPPLLFDKRHQEVPGAPECTITTRWHIVVFSSATAAARFREFQRLAQRLHEVRISMKYYNHPDAAKVYAVRVTLDDRRGLLQLAPADAAISLILSEAQDANAASAALLADFHDPLETFKDLP